MKPIVEVKGLWKEYRRGAQKEKYLSLRDNLFSNFKPSKKKESFWALEDINFEVYPGDSLAIIGKNGAGKSTLLKILSKITPPTKGEITLRGRLASLLEVGTGFHQELTGRENIYLNGSILGLGRQEINRQFDAIVDFSGVEAFLDTPLKHYSSGMQLRLAFAVAAHLEPEILVIDEVLAVGDSTFQQKCLGKMEEVSMSGRTIIFVSHNETAVSQLTRKAVLLRQGKISSLGDTQSVLQEYRTLEANHESTIWINDTENSGNDILSVEILTSTRGQFQVHGSHLEIVIELKIEEVGVGYALSFQVVDIFGKAISHSWLLDSETKFCQRTGLVTAKCLVPSTRLYMGTYSLNVFFSEPPGGKTFRKLEKICPFTVSMPTERADFPYQPNAAVFIEDYVWSYSYEI
jgi:lipopolysaccharide transport system ATP-binding protein